MATVAVASFVARSLRADALTIVLAWLGLAYAAAPLLLALVSSFFQSIASRRRAVAGYFVLFALVGIPTLLFVAISPPAAVLTAGLTCTIWSIQIEIYNNIHEKQEEAEYKAKRDQTLQREP